MAYNWSISTTLRNPDRMIGWLRVVNDFLVGETWNHTTQIKYQILLIQHKLYKPNNITVEEKEKFENLDMEISFNEAKRIFDRQNYEDPAMRGRTSMSPLKKLGLVKINNNDIISITSLGSYLLSDNYDFGYFLFRVFLKWEYRNPIEKTINTNFNINPFIATLHLINQVNEIALSNNDVVKGISRDEFMVFVQTLTDYTNISRYAGLLYEYRQLVSQVNRNNSLTNQQKEELKKNKKLEILSLLTEEQSETKLLKLLKNLKDYTDNTIRYFRATRYLHIRGGGYYIDLEPRRRVEIEALLNTYDGSSSMFEDENEYLEYLSDINLPILPWETISELKNIIGTLIEELNELEYTLNIPLENYTTYIVNDVEQLKNNIQILRDKRKVLLDRITHNELQNISKIEECINALKNIRNLPNKPSIELEKWATRALNALNDALSINPNYPVGDDNEPLFTAPAGKADIECYYESFNSICEVTMLTGRDQWYNEGQPVMRHLREFEEQQTKTSYCLFIAPKLHQDTINTFWMSTKYEYQGQSQKIVPLTINQLVELLKILIEIKQANKSFYHTNLKKLFDSIIELTQSISNSQEWINQIPNVIKEWKEEVVA